MTAIIPGSDLFWITMLTVVPIGALLLIGRWMYGRERD